MPTPSTRRPTAGRLMLLVLAWCAGAGLGGASAQHSGARAQGAAPGEGAAAAGEVAFVGGLLFDGSGAPATPLGLLIVRDGRVAQIHPPQARAVADYLLRHGDGRPGVRLVDASGCTVMPGLIDLHAHVSVPGGSLQLMPTGSAEDHLASHLHCGVTRVLDLHADPASIFALRERSRAEPGLATLHAAGGAFTAPGGHPTQFGGGICNTVTSAEEVHARFAALAGHAPDAVKAVVEHGGWGGLPALPALDRALLAELAALARAARIPLLCHVWTADEARAAVAAGADALVHGVFVGDVDEELLAAMRAQGTAYVPTLAVVFGSARSLAGSRPYAGKLARQALHPALAGALNDGAHIAALASGPMAGVLADGGEARCLAHLKRIADAGIALGLGTDAGNPFTPHGPAVLFELQLYVEAGLSPAQALAAATSGNAAILRLADVGTLAPGAVADVLVVRGDPTRDIAALQALQEVYKGGVRVDRAAHAARQAERARPATTAVVGRDLPARLFDGAPPAAAPPGGSATDAASGRAHPAAGTAARPWTGAWEAYADSMAPGGTSSAALTWLDDEQGTRLRLHGMLEAGFAWGAFAGAAVLWDAERRLLADASGFTGVRLRLRGTPRDAHLALQCAAVKDWNIFVAPLRPTAAWSVVEIPFGSLRQIGYGEPVSFTGTDLTGLNLEARNSPYAAPVHGPFELEVDWIEFY